MPGPVTSDIAEARKLYKRLRNTKAKRQLLALVTRALTNGQIAHISQLVKQGASLCVEHGPEQFEEEMAQCIENVAKNLATDDVDEQLAASMREFKLQDADQGGSSPSDIEPSEVVDMAMNIDGIPMLAEALTQFTI